MTDDFKKALEIGVAFRDNNRFGILSLVRQNDQDLFVIKYPTRRVTF